MAKKQSFSDKASKKKHVEVCPVCESSMTRVKWIKGEKDGVSVRYRTMVVAVCKCNQAEIYG